MADLFEGYELGSGWDETFGEPGLPRSTYDAILTALRPLGTEELGPRVDALARAFMDSGVTSAYDGQERPFPVDIVPRVIAADEWDLVDRGVQQRVRALEAFLADVYGAGEVLRDGIVPREVVVTSRHFHREAYGIEPPNGVRIHVSGVELVEGRDLFCAGNRVYMATTSGERPVHVVYRRIDDDFLDPVHFRPDSALGCPGIVNAARAGHVALANALGNGVADDKLIYSYVPDLVRYYLAEEPVLPNVDTYRLGDLDVREHVLERLGELVLKPVDGSGGKGLVIGPQADEPTLADLRAKVEADPRAWIAQPVVTMSTVPTFTDDGFRPRHVDLRPFAVNDGDRVWVLPGGLTRVALGQGELVVNSSRGGGSKDTWVLAGDDIAVAESNEHAEIGEAPPRPSSAPDPGPADRRGAEQQQQ